MSIDLSQFVAEFLQESQEGLDLMEAKLLQFSGESEDVDSIFRAAHSIKGGAGTFGFLAIANFTHGIETILDEMREDSQFGGAQVIDLLLESVDMLRAMFQATEDDTELNPQAVESLNQRILHVLERHSIPVSSLDTPASAAVALESMNDSSANCWLISFKPKLELLKSGNEPLHIFEALGELGKLDVSAKVDGFPARNDFDVESVYVNWQLKLHAIAVDDGSIAQQIDEIFEWVEDFCELVVTPAGNSSPMVSSSQSTNSAEPGSEITELLKSGEEQEPLLTEVNQSQNKKYKKKPAAVVNSVRVDTDKLDELMNRVGELVVTQAMLAQALEGLMSDGYQDQRLEQGLLQLESNTRDLQEGVMRMRMLPVSFVFNRFPRLVHDLCNTLDKKVKLEISGGQTEIDKTVMEKIGDPLTHLIRNALDHGLEGPQERVANGKSEVGTIALNAYHQNGFVVIDIIDDGRGLDLKKIQAKAIEKGLISKEQTLTEQEVQALIFQAGFSTVDQLSQLSGRGVGMDVVLRNIESLGGQVNIVSREKQGTSFSVKVPLTLAIIEGQIIYVGDEIYVLPLVAISETVFIQPAEVRGLGSHSHFIMYRDEYIHLIDLKELFDSSSANQKQQNRRCRLLDNQSPLLVIVAECGGRKVGLIIEQLAAQQQFVVKPLEDNFKKVQGFIGGTILGDGSVSLILDTAGLIALDERRNNVLPISNEVALSIIK